jgi:hypothetical protein
MIIITSVARFGFGEGKNIKLSSIRSYFEVEIKHFRLIKYSIIFSNLFLRTSIHHNIFLYTNYNMKCCDGPVRPRLSLATAVIVII